MSNFKVCVDQDNVKWFKEVINTIVGCLSEVRIEITETGLKLSNLDKSHIMFAELDLKPEFFTEFFIDNSIPVIYTASVGELYHVLNKHAIQEQFDPNSGDLFFIQPRKDEYYWRKLNNGTVYQNYIDNLNKNGFWVDTEDLNRVIKRLRAGDTFSLSDDEGSLIVNIEGKSSKQFRINKIDFEYDVPKQPTLKGLSEASIIFESYKEAIMDIKMLKFNDKLYFSLLDDKLCISTRGKDGEALIKLGAKTAYLDKSIKSCYSLFRIIGAIRGLKECKTELKIELGQDTPIRFTYPDKNSTGFFKSLIAPRIEAEE